MSYIDHAQSDEGWHRPASEGPKTKAERIEAGLSGLSDALSRLRAMLGHVEAWLDRRGRGAWIAAMLLAMIFCWPLGLALIAYMTYANKWSKIGRAHV